MKKIFKAIMIGSFTLVIVAVIFIASAFYWLPSASTISKVMKQTVSSVANSKVNSAPGTKSESNAATATANEIVETKEVSVDSALGDKVYDDLVAIDKPLSNFCQSLKNAKVGKFSEDDFKEALAKSVDLESQDPRIQAAKPFLRYVLRLPKVNQLFTEVGRSADESNQPSLLDKAQFYATAYSAFSEMKQHQGDLESALDRGYLFMGLNNLVAKKPELLNDTKIQSFCDNTEILFNQLSPVDFDREKNDFLNLVKDSGLQPSDISFDPNYKSNLDLQLDGQSLTLNGGWLEDLIKPSATEMESDNSSVVQ